MARDLIVTKLLFKNSFLPTKPLFRFAMLFYTLIIQTSLYPQPRVIKTAENPSAIPDDETIIVRIAAIKCLLLWPFAEMAQNF